MLNDYSHGIKITSVRGMDLSPADKGQKLILQEETHEKESIGSCAGSHDGSERRLRQRRKQLRGNLLRSLVQAPMQTL